MVSLGHDGGRQCREWVGLGCHHPLREREWLQRGGGFIHWVWLGVPAYALAVSMEGTYPLWGCHPWEWSGGVATRVEWVSQGGSRVQQGGGVNELAPLGVDTTTVGVTYVELVPAQGSGMEWVSQHSGGVVASIPSGRERGWWGRPAGREPS